MKEIGADFPSMVTLTPSRAVGRRPAWKSASRQARVVPERNVPNMETQLPGAMDLPKPAASSTPPAEMTGFCTGAWIV
jgi:hypothetical protein